MSLVAKEKQYDLSKKNGLSDKFAKSIRPICKKCKSLMDYKGKEKLWHIFECDCGTKLYVPTQDNFVWTDVVFWKLAINGS